MADLKKIPGGILPQAFSLADFNLFLPLLLAGARMQAPSITAIWILSQSPYSAPILQKMHFKETVC
jgi:hypothetical protein